MAEPQHMWPGDGMAVYDIRYYPYCTDGAGPAGHLLSWSGTDSINKFRYPIES